MRPSARIVQRVWPLAMVITRVPDYHVFVRMPGPHLSNLLFACYHLHLMSSTLFAESTAKQLAAVIMHHPAVRILPLAKTHSDNCRRMQHVAIAMVPGALRITLALKCLALNSSRLPAPCHLHLMDAEAAAEQLAAVMIHRLATSTLPRADTRRQGCKRVCQQALANVPGDCGVALAALCMALRQQALKEILLSQSHGPPCLY